jgi:transcriptional regulator with GAF, ATPase, and Fis domain
MVRALARNGELGEDAPQTFEHNMNVLRAHIVAVMGPQSGTSFMVRDELTVGRDPANHVRLDDFAVSRKHCVFVSSDGRFLVRDMGSHNGTFVNGVAVEERELKHEDRIAIGGSVFQFAVQDSNRVPDTASIAFADLPLRSGSAETSVVVGVSGEGENFKLAPERLSRDFGVLLMIATRLRGVKSAESLLWQLVGVLMEVIPTERVAILLGETAATLEPGFAWDKIAGPGKPIQVSRTIVQRVMSGRRAILINDAPRVVNSTSVEALDVHSLLCVPLCTPEKQLGVIYMDCRKPGVCFDAGHLHLMSAIAGIAALALENTRFIEMLALENEQLKAEVRVQFDMIGDGSGMQELYRFISKVAPTDSNVLIQGESGTGKELVARAIHRTSSRADKTFVAINCAAITETLLESELFGHEKGAFTGASAQKRGYLEVADGGTVFLDEIGELALPLQAKLLRVLQERELVRVGGTKPIKVDIRVLAATNRTLSEAVKEGKFREDLFYRLNVLSCQIPPLRKRREDIPLLAQHFVEKYGAKCARKIRGLTKEAVESLQRYDWPGNVRELENAIERAVVLGSTPEILRDDLPESVLEVQSAAESTGTGYHDEVARRKKELILEALEKSDGNFTEAAKLLGVHPNYLHRLVRVLDLRETVKAKR